MKNLLLVSPTPHSARLASQLFASGFNITTCDASMATRALRGPPCLALLIDRQVSGAVLSELGAHLRAMPPPRPGVIVLESGPFPAEQPALEIAPGQRRARCDALDSILAILRELAEHTRESSGEHRLRLASGEVPAPAESAQQGDVGPPSDTSPRPGATQTACTILVVDDSFTFRTVLGDRLSRLGHEVQLASSGQQAIDMVQRRAPNAMVIDLLMPGMDGLETCRRLRRTAEGSDLPILMLTGSDDIRSRMDGRAAGASEVLIKVLDFEAVVAGVGDFLRRTIAIEHLPHPRSPAASGMWTRSPTPAVVERDLFAELVAATGLSRVIAEPAITRACRRAGAHASSLTVDELHAALPFIERALRTYLPSHEVASRLEAVAALVARTPRRAGGKG